MNTIATQKRTYRLPRRQAGLSLVELMISLTIGLILLAGITTLIVQQSSTRDELEKSSRQIENGRYAMQILHDDIQHAGFYGEYSPASGVAYTVPADPCAISTDSGWATTPTVPVPIFGYSGAGADPTASTTCGLTNYKPNTAVLVIRRTATATVAAADGVASYLQVSLCGTVTTPFVFGTTGFTLMQKDCLAPALLWPYTVNIYYISSCDICTPSSDNIPTLKMVQAGPTAAPVPTPLVEGIENMQFDYGLDNTGDGAPDSYTTTPASTDWQNVMAVRVNLLARNNDPTVGYQDTKTYSLGGAGAVGPFNAAPYTLSPACGGTASYPQLCNYKRHAYSELVRAINPSGRRE